MAYVEYLRVRRALTVYAIVVFAAMSILTISLQTAHVRLSGSDVHIDAIPLTLVLTIAGFGSLVLGTLLAGTLNRERDTLALSWTRPIARERMAATMMAIDLGGVVAAFALTLVLSLMPLVTVGLLTRVVADPHAPGAVANMFGVTVMWYGIVQAATSWYRGRAGLVVGLSWPAFGLLLVLGRQTRFGPVVQTLAAALDYLNPLAYLLSHDTTKGGTSLHESAYLALPESALTAMAWALGIAACAVAIAAWKRSEA